MIICNHALILFDKTGLNCTIASKRKSKSLNLFVLVYKPRTLFSWFYSPFSLTEQYWHGTALQLQLFGEKDVRHAHGGQPILDVVRTFLRAIAPWWTRQEERQQARSTVNQVSYQQLEIDFTGSAVVDAADVSTDDAELPTLISCIDINAIANLILVETDDCRLDKLQVHLLSSRH
ncbi:hypothetical protein LC612_42580 [Nostoc sp. CHAB 5834]|nr:hypothetical protein [Nostoc sp. CHAB 5834]